MRQDHPDRHFRRIYSEACAYIHEFSVLNAEVMGEPGVYEFRQSGHGISCINFHGSFPSDLGKVRCRKT